MEDLVITRAYDAPRALVFAAWTEPERLKHWWAPDGCTVAHCTVDLRAGGKRHVCIRTPGRDFWAVGVYREVVVPERLVYVDAAGDAAGNPVSAKDYGMSADFPTETLVTVTFAEQGGRTIVTLRQTLPKVFPERAAMEEGWHEMFRRLAENLA
jgi:uncharacterized protein YndB with AHSA1/START domain